MLNFSFGFCIYFLKVYTISSNTYTKFSQYRKIALARAKGSIRVIFHWHNCVGNLILYPFEVFSPINTFYIFHFILYLIFDIAPQGDNFWVLLHLYLISKLFPELGLHFCYHFRWSLSKLIYFVINFLLLYNNLWLSVTHFV